MKRRLECVTECLLHRVMSASEIPAPLLSRAVDMYDKAQVGAGMREGKTGSVFCLFE